MWIYTFIRTDLPIAQQIVQAAHSAYESGRGSTYPYPRMVLIAIKNVDEMQQALDYAERIGIKSYPFYEQDLAYGLTSFTTRPVYAEERQYFKQYKLWRAENVLDL